MKRDGDAAALFKAGHSSSFSFAHASHCRQLASNSAFGFLDRAL
jgi:hypothetical protein